MTITSKKLCPNCGADLAVWREVYGHDHYCPQEDPEPDETFEQARADALYDAECERRMGL